MIVGVGCDIVKVTRIQQLIKKFGLKFLRRICTESEIERAQKLALDKSYYKYFAKRFAAKEAVAKALGTGIGEFVSFTDIEIQNLQNGRPIVKLSCNNCEAFKVHISLADEEEFAVAYAIVESVNKLPQII
ncbi:MAG: holo-(acyl-carrier-protein) synthase [Candidatus Midichloriaceae bacterium]|jgi:holo-[acyl-carrier protein] synthase|nr:holo-(acyl-carrier-protein) synthase [Candidatus Midichloriaceae bacterium]